MNKTFLVNKFILMILLVFLLVPTKCIVAQWHVVADDAHKRAMWEMFQIVVPDRQGDFPTKNECEDAIDQAGMDALQRSRHHCECETNCDEQSTNNNQSSSYSNYSSGTNDLNGMIMQSIIQPLFQNLFDMILSPPENNSGSGGYSDSDREAENERYKKAHEEYQRKVLEQVTKANNQYTSYSQKKFENQKQTTVNEFKNRIAKSESVKNIKLLNCAASRSLEISHLVLDGQLDFNDLTGPAEDLRALSEFENIKLSNCPEIEVKVPEVSVVNPVAFQEVFFQTIKNKSDSIVVKVGLIKEKEKKIKEVIVEKEKIVEKLKSKEPVVNETNQNLNKAEEDKLLQDALNALNEAVEEENKVTEELQRSERY